MSISTFNSVSKIQLLLSVTLLASQGSAYLFQPVVASCMYWDLLSTHHKNDEPYKIHCIQDENGLPGIVNTTWKLVQAGYCPYYDRHGKTINLRRCNSGSRKCPAETIFSYEAVRYAGCYSSSEATITYLPKIGLTVTTKEPNTEQLQFTCSYKLEGIIGIIFIASVSSIVIVGAFALLLTVKKKMLQRSKLGLTKIEGRCCERRNSQKSTTIPADDLERTEIPIFEKPSIPVSNNEEKDLFLLDYNTEPPTGSKQLHNADGLSYGGIVRTTHPSNQDSYSEDKDSDHG